MAEGGFMMQNQLKFNLDNQPAASNMAVRYHKPNPIMVERVGGLVQPVNHAHVKSQPPESTRSSIAEDRMALAVRLAQRDLKKQRDEGQPMMKRDKSPKQKPKPKFSKAGTRMVYTREAEERAARLQQKQASRGPLKAREAGWNSGTSVARTQTPPRDRQARLNMPATTNSPPTRDTDRYPRSAPLENPGDEIMRLQREMEGYLQQIQVIEQRAMREDSQPAKSRKKDGYLSDEEDPARRALRQEEQATRSARQVYNLRQQVRALEDQINRRGNVKHTKKSQVMLRLAAAHRGAVRAIQGFVNQQLPQSDLRRGLPTGYQDLATLIRQLVSLSSSIKSEHDVASVHSDLLNMLNRVEELNKAWQMEQGVAEDEGAVEERRRKSPHSAPPSTAAPSARAQGRQPAQRQRFTGKENRPKGLLKKHVYKGSRPIQKSQKPRKVSPERQQVLQAGLQALLQAKMSGETSVLSTADNTHVSEAANTSLILTKPLQYKRERAQRSVAMAIPDSHFTDATLTSHLKSVPPGDGKSASGRDPWKPGGSLHKSPSRARSQDRSKSRERGRSQDGNRGRHASLDRSRSYSPKSRHINCMAENMDAELMHELFPGGGQQPRSTSARSRSQRDRSPSPARSPSSRYTGHQMRSRLDKAQRRAQRQQMLDERDREMAEIHLRQMLDDQACKQAEVNGEAITDMILADLMHETATELHSLEDESFVQQGASKLTQNPTLENMYQRLEQMELEQADIRRRWGGFNFEEESTTTSRSVRQLRTIERPSGPVAMEITRHGPSQSHRVQHSRGYDKESDQPIIFTKSAPVQRYEERVIPLEREDEDLLNRKVPLPFQRGRQRLKLKLSDAAVRDVRANLEKYERHLKTSSHQTTGRFDPWKLVEEVSDRILNECLQEIEKELDDIGDNIVHQVCKSEFAVPESPPQEVSQQFYPEAEEEVESEDYGTPPGWERQPVSQNSKARQGTSQQEVEAVSILRTSGDRSLLQESMENGADGRSTNRDKPLKKEVSFKQDDTEYGESEEESMTYEPEKTDDAENSLLGSARGAIFDAADLDMALDDRDLSQQPQTGPPVGSARVIDHGDDYDDDEYEDDYDDYEDDDDDDDVEKVSPMNSVDLNYSEEDT